MHINPYTGFDGGQVISYTPTAEGREILSKPPEDTLQKERRKRVTFFLF